MQYASAWQAEYQLEVILWIYTLFSYLDYHLTSKCIIKLPIMKSSSNSQFSSRYLQVFPATKNANTLCEKKIK